MRELGHLIKLMGGSHLKFQLNPNFSIDTELAPWKTEGLRIGLWGGSGSGKSYTAALLLEQFLSQDGTIIIFEPRAEYQTLKEKWDIVVCGGPYAKDMDFIPIKPHTYAKAVVEQGVSLIFYTSDVEDETKLIEFTSRFLSYLLKLNEVVKRPIMLVAEETQEYAPASTKGRISPPWVFSRMIKSFKTTSIDARKLNIVPISLSPRPQEVNFTIRQLCNLTFYGKFSPQDSGYVDRECLKPLRQHGTKLRGEDLLKLQTGEFAVVFGSTAKEIHVTEARLTKHGAETPKLTYIAPRKDETRIAINALAETIMQGLRDEEVEESTVTKLRKELASASEQIDRLNKDLEQKDTALQVAGAIKITQPEVSEAQIREKVTREVSQTVTNLKADIIEVLSKYQVESPTQSTTQHNTTVYDVWAPKLPHAAKRILKLLAVDKRGLHMTKREIGVALGYRTTGGSFTGAISTLKRNHLIKSDGNTLWVE